MGKFVKGDIVLTPFPYSDLSSSKLRPVLILGEPGGVDFIVCMITSQNRPGSQHSIELTNTSLKEGHINVDSWIRADRIFSGDSRLISRKIGAVTNTKFQEVIDVIIKIISL